MPPTQVWVSWPSGVDASTQVSPRCCDTRDVAIQTSAEHFSISDGDPAGLDDCSGDGHVEDWELLAVSDLDFDHRASRRKYRGRAKLPRRSLPCTELASHPPSRATSPATSTSPCPLFTSSSNVSCSSPRRAIIEGGIYRGPTVSPASCTSGLFAFVDVQDVSFFVCGTTLVRAAERLGPLRTGDHISIEIMIDAVEGPRNMPRVSKLFRDGRVVISGA